MPTHLSTLCILTASVVAVAADWPQFRGPKGDGHADAKNLPQKWSDTENVRWKVAIHDRGWSSPIVVGKQVWVTTATQKGDKCYAVALDRDTGKAIHDVLVFEVDRPVPKVSNSATKGGAAAYHEWEKFNTYASPTPVFADGKVYVHYGISGTACLDATTGKILWKRTDLECNHHRGAGSSPIVAGGSLILTFDGYDVQFLVALDLKSGETVWKKDRKFHPPEKNGDLKKAYGTPLLIQVNNRDLIVSPSAEATAAYDPKTGEEIWRVVHGGMNASLRPVFGKGLVFTASSDGGKQLVAIKPDGKGDVTKSHIAWEYSKGVPNRSSFLIDGDRMFLVNTNAITTCLNVSTGKELGKARLDTKGKFWGSPLLADGKWYAFDDEGLGFVISADEKMEVLSMNKLPDGCRASPAAADNALYVRTFTHLYRIEEKK